MQLGQDPQALVQAMDWARAEGWEVGLGDGTAFATVDPEGWFSARTDDGDIATTLSAIKYDDSFGFIGLYITKPELRGQGIGRQVWRLGREHLAGCRAIGLDGVLEREHTYASDGFVRSHVTTRFAGKAAALAAYTARALPSDSPKFSIADPHILGAEVLSAFELDHALFPAPRERFLAAWLAIPESASVAALSNDGALEGWGMIRPSVGGWRIGPLFANDEIVAATLLRDLANRVPDADTVFIDIPEPNSAAVSMVRAAGFEPIFGCVRMYAGEAPELALDKIYANTTFELG